MIMGHDQHVSSLGQAAEHLLPEYRHRRMDLCHAGIQHWQFRQELRTRIHQMQHQIMAGEDAGQFHAHMAHPEDRHRGNNRQRLQQHRDFSAAALAPERGWGLVAELHGDALRLALAHGDHLAGPFHHRHLQVAPANGPEDFLAGDHHLCARLARGMPAHRGDGCQHARPPLIAQRGDRFNPREHGYCPSRTDSIAQNTASGVAGDASCTERPAGPNAATACRIASRTEKASISGGSPTALEP